MNIIDIFLHLDKYLGGIISAYGPETYILLFLIIFCETGLVITPFLPGDSILFAAGAFAAIGSLDIFILTIILLSAAILGNISNYQIGRSFGNKLLKKEKLRILKKEYIYKTEKFYDKYGGLTIIISRFMPIVRTFTPFLAGTGKMTYGKFIIYNIIGGTLWIVLFCLGGYYFGNLEYIKRNFSLVVIAIVIISMIPALIGYIKGTQNKKTVNNI